MTGGSIRVLSPAKINWTLRVVGKRADGFHEIESLLSAVTLCDTLRFATSDQPGIKLTCDEPLLATDSTNLVVRAAARVSREPGAPATAGVICRLEKRIPMGGGLGGGSSNAAATLIALSRMWQLDATDEHLIAWAAQLGSDVPFFIRGGSAVMRGRGERVEQVDDRWPGWIVLLFPPFSISTGQVYRAWQPPADDAAKLWDPLAVLRADGAEARMHATFNMLEAPALDVCPPLAGLMDRAASLAARPVRLSGSGSTLFTAFDSQQEADSAADEMARRLDVRTAVVRMAAAAGEHGPAKATT